MRYFKHILSILLLQLVLFTAHGRVNILNHIGGTSVHQKNRDNYSLEHGVIMEKTTRDLLSAHHHSGGAPGLGAGKQLTFYLQANTPQWLHSCSKAHISSIFARLLEYCTFYQDLALFPKHWFW